MNLGSKIKQLRLSKGVTQEELGNACGVTQRAVSKWEQGAVDPQEDTKEKIALYFGITVSDLYNKEFIKKIVLAAVKEKNKRELEKIKRELE